MSEINRAVKGTNDVLPENVHKIQFLENKLFETASLFGFKEIRVPVFEHTEVFSRNVGDTTDVVQKEMYTFEDKGGRSITLRPELTAGTARSVIEHGLINGALPLKVCYAGGCYRYEKPQAGRLREFHQFGVECYGATSASADAEVISLARQALNDIGLKNISLEINSIGCSECRKNYVAALKEYFGKFDQLCNTCKERLERNPMRILDCKSPVCKEIAKDAPKVIDYLCDDCKEHFEDVKRHLDAADIKYTVNPNIVRGLDYYNRTVFEFISNNIGAQSTVCGGGRYDGLIKSMGGPDVAALGFAMGIERLLLVLENTNAPIPEPDRCDIYIVSLGNAATFKATELCSKLRTDGFEAQCDICGRGLKAQMKYADKIGALYTVCIGDNEIESNSAEIKDMSDGTLTKIELDNIPDKLMELKCEKAFKDIENTVL